MLANDSCPRSQSRAVPLVIPTFSSLAIITSNVYCNLAYGLQPAEIIRFAAMLICQCYCMPTLIKLQHAAFGNRVSSMTV